MEHPSQSTPRPSQLLACPYSPSLARSVRDAVAARIKAVKATSPRFSPTLAIVQAGARPDSATYIRMKSKAAEEVGIQFKHVTLPAEATVERVVDTVKSLNADVSISGILVQLPLGDHVTPEGERQVTEAIDPEKDVDGSVHKVPAQSPLNSFLSQKFPCLQHWPFIFQGVETPLLSLHSIRSHPSPRIHWRRVVWGSCCRSWA